MRKPLCLIVLLLLFTSGCLVNPDTGKIGPAWQIPVRVPLLATDTTLTELVEKEIQISPIDGGILAGEFVFTEDIHLSEMSFDLKPIVRTVTESNIKFPSNKTVEFTLETQIDTTSLFKHGTLESITFNGGTASLSFNDTVHPDVNIKSITLNGKRFETTTIPLAELTLSKNDKLIINGEAPIADHKIQQVILTFDIKTQDITSITGTNLQLELPEKRLSFDFDFPQELDELEFLTANLNLLLNYSSLTNEPPQIDLQQIEITDLSLPATTSFVGTGNFKFATDEVTALLNKRPEEIVVKGSIIVGSSTSATVNFRDTLDLIFELNVPLQFNMTKDIVYESEVFSLDLRDIPLDSLDNLTSAIHAELRVNYRLPLGFDARIYISNEQQPLQDQNALVLHSALPSSLTDDAGMALSADRAEVAIEVPKTIYPLLRENAYAQLQITIPAPTNNNVTFSSGDFVEIAAWLELMANINK